MTFDEILEGLKQGRTVKRKNWGGFWRIEILEGLDNPTIVATLKDTGTRVAATAYQEDILADDWEFVCGEDQCNPCPFKDIDTGEFIKVTDRKTGKKVPVEDMPEEIKQLIIRVIKVAKGE